MNQQILRQGLPAELLNELFGSLPFGNAFGLLAKMPNSILARNIQKMINGIKETMKNNKINRTDCGQRLAISENGFIATHIGPREDNCVRTNLSIPLFKLNGCKKSAIVFYFEIQILRKSIWIDGIRIGFCTKQFRLECKVLGWKKTNSIGFWCKGGMKIDGSWTGFVNVAGCFNEGNLVGLGIIRQPNSNMECFATSNGELLGKIVLPKKFAELELFPIVSLYDPDDSISVNFGKEEWNFKEFGRVLE